MTAYEIIINPVTVRECLKHILEGRELPFYTTDFDPRIMFMTRTGILEQKISIGGRGQLCLSLFGEKVYRNPALMEILFRDNQDFFISDSHH